MDSAQMHFCRDLWMLSAREGVRNDAKKARDRERKGLQRGLSDEMEKIVKVVAPQYAPAVKGGGGILGFGRKAPAVVDNLPSDSNAEDNEDEWDEEESTTTSGADKAKDAGGHLKDAAGKIIDEVIKPKEQTPEEKEQAMVADAAAAALPVEEQHPNAGVNPNPPAEDGLKAKEDAGQKVEDQFVDPEALLEKEALALEAEQKAAADKEKEEEPALFDEDGVPGKKKVMKGAQADAAIDGDKLEEAGSVPDAPKAPLAAKVDVEAPAPPEDARAGAGANKKQKRDAIPGGVAQNEKRDDQEKKANNLPGPADPNALRGNSEAGKKRPVGVNNADEADSLDAAAPKAPEKAGNNNNDGKGQQAANSGSGSGYKNRALKNSAFTPARIIVNPRCVTTYAGVSHTQLALDLFGSDDDSDDLLASGARKGSLLSDDEEDDGLGTSSVRQKSFNDKYALGEFGNAAETFVCQEMRTSGEF